MTDTALLIEELVIARYRLWTYPSVEDENHLFKQHFFHLSRSFRVGESFLVVHNGLDQSRSCVAWHLLKDPMHLCDGWCFPYFVQRIVPVTNGTSSVYNEVRPERVYISSKKHTNVILSGTYARRLSIAAVTAEMVRDFINEKSLADDVYSPPMLFLPLEVDASGVAFIATKEQWCFLDMGNATRHRSGHSSVLHGITQQILDVLVPLVTIAEIETDTEFLSFDGEIDLKIADTYAANFLQQIRNPVLLSSSSESFLSLRDVRSGVQACAMALCMRYVTLDARLLIRFGLKSSYAALHEGIHGGWIESAISELTPARIASEEAPCIIHIENIDLIFQDPLLQQQGGGMQVDESLEEQFSMALKQFVKELYDCLEPVLVGAANAQLHDSYEAVDDISRHDSFSLPNCDEGDACLQDGAESEMSCSDVLSNMSSKANITQNLLNHTILIVVTTRHYEAMKPSLTSQFASVFQLRGKSFTEEGGNTYNTRGDVEQMIADNVQSLHGDCISAYCELTHAVYDAALVRCESSKWLRDVGLSHLANGEYSVDDSECERQTLAVDVRTVKTLTPQLNGVPGSDYTAHQLGLNHITTKSSKSASIAAVQWEDIGGLDRVRKEILDVLELPFKYPHLFGEGCPRRQGVLLYGPPGTGKTLVAKAVATECGMSFLSVKGPELLDAYVGESEKNVREIFARARSQAPCVLFFDEIDSLAPARAKGNDSGGGVMDRIVSQLLTEIDQLVMANAQAVVSANGMKTTGISEEAELKKCLFRADFDHFSLSTLPGEEYQTETVSSSNYDGRKERESEPGAQIVEGIKKQMGRALFGDETPPEQWQANQYCGELWDPPRESATTEFLRLQRLYSNNVVSDDIEVKRSSHSENSHSVDDSNSIDQSAATHKNGKFVFIIAATNRPDLLDAALLRPGRFDRKIYLGVCKDSHGRAQILKAQTRKFKLADDIDLNAAAAAMADNVTGADIGSVSSSAYSLALDRKINQLMESAIRSQNPPLATAAEGTPPNDFKRMLLNMSFDIMCGIKSYVSKLSESDLDVVITQEDLLAAAVLMKPSVKDLTHYESLGEVYDDTLLSR